MSVIQWIRDGERGAIAEEVKSLAEVSLCKLCRPRKGFLILVRAEVKLFDVVYTFWKKKSLWLLYEKCIKKNKRKARRSLTHLLESLGER